MLVLVINSGSSSLKFQLLNMENEKVLAKGLVERIGNQGDAVFTYQAKGLKERTEASIPTHKDAIAYVTNALLLGEGAVLNSLEEIGAVGHRVVQGGTDFDFATCITRDVIQKIRKYSSIAPLHNPPALAGITACQAHMPGIPQVAVFDTAFHHTMDKAHYLYGIPYEDYEKLGVRRYGAHGTSHKYVAFELAKAMGRPFTELRLITCHLGNGASITAIRDGKVVTTSMGFTPLEGLMMGTRTGDIDAAAVLHLMEQKGFDTVAMDDYLNRNCGLLGVSGLSNDFRDIEAAMERGHKRSMLAYDMFVLRVRQYIGAYVAFMNGVDAIAFTAGIGENDDMVRASVCKDLDYLGIKIDPELNKGCREQKELTAEGAKVRTFVIPTNEELAIAREVMESLMERGCDCLTPADLEEDDEVERNSRGEVVKDEAAE